MNGRTSETYPGAGDPGSRERRQAASITLAAEASSEKQVRRLLSSAKTKLTVRMIVSAAIALLEIIAAAFLSFSFAYRGAATPVALAGALIGIIYQIIGSITIFTSIHSEELDSPETVELKQRILGFTGLLTGGIAAVTAFMIPVFRVRLDGSWSSMEEMSAAVTGVVWSFVVLVLWAALYFIIKYFITQNGHEYLKD